MSEIYLDNNATTPVAPEVLETMVPYFTEAFGNPSSLHTKGVEAQRAVTNARHTLARLLGVSESEIVFTSGATESVNLALKGVAERNKKRGQHIVTSAVEHDAVLEACRDLEEDGFLVTYVKPDEYGRVSPEAVADAVRDDTVLVAVMHVNNELGTINDIDAIGRDAKQKKEDVCMMSDGAQAFGKMPTDLKNIDLYSISAHKMHGPKGVGALFVREGARIRPQMAGGGQEGGVRSGTENVPGIVGLAKAAEVAYAHLDENRAHLKEIKQVFLDGISEIENVHVNSPDDALETTANVSFIGIRAETLLHALEEKGVYVSTGSACSTGDKIQSHVLEAIDASHDVKDSALRFSFSRMNTKKEIEEAVTILKGAVAKLRQ